MSTCAPTVLGWRRDGSDPAALTGLWQRVDELGWLSGALGRVVIQVGRAWRSPLVLETARSLAEFLVTRVEGVVVDVLKDVASEENIPIRGIAVSGPLAVPVSWFSSHYLVTISGAGPSRESRIAGVLEAQADALREAGAVDGSDAIIYEAHRLGASDLAVTCGYAELGVAGSESWWVVGPSDVAVDQIVGRAAGVEPGDLPWVRVIARHELLEPAPELLGSLPPLRGYVAPAPRVALNALKSRIDASVRYITHDVRMLRRNLRRIPASVWRRLTRRWAA